MHVALPLFTLLFLLLLVGGFFFWPAWLIAVPVLGLLVYALAEAARARRRRANVA
jgi:hypothetical protein